MVIPRIYLRFFVVFGLWLGVMSMAPVAYAGLSLSINPIDGGSGIRFDRIVPGLNNAKQLQIRVNSTAGGNKYQVFQRVSEPITNEKGQALNLSAVAIASLSNSNTSGALYLQNADHLSFNEQLIYSSGQGGESDMFTLVYNVSPDLINGSGNVRGRVIFTVRSQGGPDQAESVVDFSLENVEQLKVSVVGGHDPKSVRMKDTDNKLETADYVKVAFSNNSSENIRCDQELVSVLTNESSGEELPLDVIKVAVQGASSNIRLGDGSLARLRTMLYSGNANQDEFRVYFLVDSAKAQEANTGTYKGQLKYTVDTGSNHQEFNIDIELNVQPVFTLDFTLPPEGISFGHVLASSPAQEKQVVVSVHSNLHKPYQVSQNLSSLMTNEKGKEFDKKYFTFKVDLGSTAKGRTSNVDFTSVDVGESPIYYSDARGSSATFTVTYQLKGYFDMHPGSFTAPLKFSLNQN
ncbi:MAG: hypothetical protein HQL15_09540 [Candidatus Omnitrophica bacterium]|nr:hypothetical protein [Candidatus Omnitrophota bacterium]